MPNIQCVARCAYNLLACGVILGGAQGCTTRAPAPQPVPLSGGTSQAHRFVDSLRRVEALPGMVVSVMQHGRVVWTEGFGLADREHAVPATPATRFRIGSVSKLLTAAALMRLVEAGALDLDRPIRTYLPDYPSHWPEMTLRQLAGHTAGVRHYRGAEFFSRIEYASLREAIAIFTGDSLLFVPGTRYAYTSYGYNLIGAVIETVTEESFPVALRRLVLDPLAMRSTVPDSVGRAIPDRAALYHIQDGRAATTPADNLSSRWPAGGYLSTTEDLARFGGALLRPGFLAQTSLDALFTPQHLANGEPTQVGIGWRIGVNEAGRRYLHHGGSSNGGSAFLLLYPEEQVVVAMAANALGSWSTAEALQLAALFRQ